MGIELIGRIPSSLDDAGWTAVIEGIARRGYPAARSEGGTASFRFPERSGSSWEADIFLRPSGAGLYILFHAGNARLRSLFLDDLASVLGEIGRKVDFEET